MFNADLLVVLLFIAAALMIVILAGSLIYTAFFERGEK